MKLPTVRFLIITLLFVQLSFTCCQVGTKQNLSLEKDILSESSISLYELSDGGTSDIADMVITIRCTDGKVFYTTEIRWFVSPEVRKYEQQIEPPNYLSLWAQIERLGIWQLKRGEFWDYRMQIWAHGLRGLPELKATQEMKDDYNPIPLDTHYTSVEVNVRNKSHGFMRKAPRYLKDQRYVQVEEAIWNFIDLEKIIRTQKAQK